MGKYISQRQKLLMGGGVIEMSNDLIRVEGEYSMSYSSDPIFDPPRKKYSITIFSKATGGAIFLKECRTFASFNSKWMLLEEKDNLTMQHTT